MLPGLKLLLFQIMAQPNLILACLTLFQKSKYLFKEKEKHKQKPTSSLQQYESNLRLQ